ncbi:hypothetical protein ABZ511_06240 [Nocardia gamkensis]
MQSGRFPADAGELGRMVDEYESIIINGNADASLDGAGEKGEWDWK